MDNKMNVEHSTSNIEHRIKENQGAKQHPHSTLNVGRSMLDVYVYSLNPKEVIVP